MIPGVAVKGLIEKEGKYLLLKRPLDEDHKPGTWDVPGGRLEPGENPFEGLKREVKEETALDIEIGRPHWVHHFTRDDGQVITMIVFLCTNGSGEIVLSHEHTKYGWFSPAEAMEKIDESMRIDFELLKN